MLFPEKKKMCPQGQPTGPLPRELMDLATGLGLPAQSYDDLADAAGWCARWLRLRARAAPPGARLAAVFDIDATLVASDARIEETCELLALCAELRIAHVLVTARPEAGRAYTEQQLARLGLAGHKRLYMHPPGVRCDASGAGREKRRARQRVAAHGYEVVLNAGDALHDHFHPVPAEAARWLDPALPHVFLTADGVAHLKLPE